MTRVVSKRTPTHRTLHHENSEKHVPRIKGVDTLLHIKRTLCLYHGERDTYERHAQPTVQEFFEEMRATAGVYTPHTDPYKYPTMDIYACIRLVEAIL